MNITDLNIGSIPLDLSIPLSKGIATLRIPIPLLEDDFDMLRESVSSYLQIHKRAIVEPASEQGEEPEDASSNE